jgi:2-keto-4-pentenoate hydratase/2-oxohepta-3-ene-1,7-dioic acid hydratase in catechol pathway
VRSSIWLRQRRRSRWLKVGDVVRMEVEGIGYLENRVVPEPPGTMGFID